MGSSVATRGLDLSNLKADFFCASSNQFFLAHFPQPLKSSSRITLAISYYVLSSVTPLPAAIDQDDKQFLTYTFSAYAPSAYTINTQKTKLKLPSTNVPDYTTTSGLKSGEDPERQGSTFTYGPYDTSKVAPGTIEPISVRYEFTKPIITCSLLERDIEVSHWGGNLATEDRYWIRNDAARLTKQFSRVDWTVKQYQNLPTRAVKLLRVPIAHGSVDPYFIDDIGNVSTSRFLPSTGNRPALLDLKPRYPVFGDWKYSFRIGWNNALSSFLRKSGPESYVLNVPFLEGPMMSEGTQYEKLELRVVLPEGAKDVKFELHDGTGIPHKVESELGLHKTFMDTIGRTVLKLTATNVADEARDSQLIVCLALILSIPLSSTLLFLPTKHANGYSKITYDYPFTAQLRKPLTIAAAILSVFVVAWGIGNVDVSIKRR